MANNPLITAGTTPASGSVQIATKAIDAVHYKTVFTLTNARVPITDGTTSGSYGSLKLGTLKEGAILFQGSLQDYTGFAEGSALTGAAGDAAIVIGVGTAAIAAAADATLATTNKDIGASISITMASGTGTGSVMTGAGTVKDGTSTAATINLNISGSAATIDATSTIDVSGTITLLWAYLADD